MNGRGSWIRTNDLQYPKLPRYQAALYPDLWNGQSIHAREPRSKALQARLNREKGALGRLYLMRSDR